MKRILLLALAAAAFVAPAGAHGAVPCRDKIYNEWYSSGKISTTYPLSCYHDALKHIPGDAQVYSNLGADIKAALQAAIARNNDPGAGGPSAVGSGRVASTTGGTKAAVKTKHDRRNGDLVAAPIASTGSGGGGGLPLPIIVLGAVALLLAAAGAVGTGVKRFRRGSAS